MKRQAHFVQIPCERVVTAVAELSSTQELRGWLGCWRRAFHCPAAFCRASAIRRAAACRSSCFDTPPPKTPVTPPHSCSKGFFSGSGSGSGIRGGGCAGGACAAPLPHQDDFASRADSA